MFIPAAVSSAILTQLEQRVGAVESACNAAQLAAAALAASQAAMYAGSP